VDINAALDTPAGRFENCVKVKITGQNSTIYEYYKEGVGLVRSEFLSGDTSVTSTLEKYNIK
jgi:phosphoenolpyruvate-protein kinase (PTS system EI component)